MIRQVLILFILVVAVFVKTDNCLAQAQVGGPAPGQASKPAAPPAPHDHTHMSSEKASAAASYFTDVELINQDGKKVRFYSDVLKGKTVVVNAFFTTCTSVCPPMNRNMEKIQEALGDRVGRDVFLVSITVDPENDTPARIKDYARKFHAGPGWTSVKLLRVLFYACGRVVLWIDRDRNEKDVTTNSIAERFLNLLHVAIHRRTHGSAGGEEG